MLSSVLHRLGLQRPTSSHATGDTHVSILAFETDADRNWSDSLTKLIVAHWNLLDYPGVVFPVTTVDPILDVADTNYTPRNTQDAFVHEMYSPEIFANAPLSLQVIARRQEDEKVLAALIEIERAMGRP